MRSVSRARRGGSTGRARPIHRVEGMECNGIRGVAHPGQGSNRRRSLICVVLVLVAAAPLATPSSAQATTDGQPGIVLSETALTIDEGGDADYTVTLGTRPSGNVRITLWRSSYDIVFRRTTAPLIFKPANWNIPQTVALRAVHDDDARDGAVVLTHSASGGGYDDVPAARLRVKVADDDEVGIVLSKPALTIDEGGDADYTVTLGTRPSGNVRIYPLAQLVRHRLPANHRASDLHARKLEHPPDGRAEGGSRRRRPGWRRCLDPFRVGRRLRRTCPPPGSGSRWPTTTMRH